jgi:hypothetical protein
MSKNLKKLKLNSYSNKISQILSFDEKKCIKCGKSDSIDIVTLSCTNIICLECLKSLISVDVKRVDCLGCNIRHNLSKYQVAIEKQPSLDHLVNAFQFSDEFFEENVTIVELDASDLVLESECWLNRLIAEHDTMDLANNLSIFHLNICSIFNKIENIDLVLDLN